MHGLGQNLTSLRTSFALIVLLPVCLIGCRTPQQITALREENRQLEERLYQIADLLAECRRENRRLREELRYRQETDKPPESGAKLEAPAVGPEPKPTREPSLPRIEVEGVPQPDSKTGELRPEILPPGAIGPSAPEWPAPQVGTRAGPARVQLAAAAEGGLAHERLLPLEPSQRIERIELNRDFTRGWDADGRPGDEGIRLQLELRDAQGQLIKAPGNLSVVVIDPALTGEEARIARWDIPASKVAESFGETSAGKGIVLFLPWPRRVPVHPRLHLFVRLVTEDGRKLERDMPIEVTLGPELAGGRSAEYPLRLPSAAMQVQGQSTTSDQVQERAENAQSTRAARVAPEWSPLR